MASNEFNQAFCKAVLSFFAIGYRKGIEDACACDDEYVCREFVEKIKHPAYFGTLTHPLLDWTEWQFKTLQWTREDACRNRILTCLMSIRSPKHNMAFVLQLMKMFYRQGILDYLECREWLTKEVVATLPRCPYLLKTRKDVRLSSTLERFEALQCVSLALIVIHHGFNFKDSGFEEYRTTKLKLTRFIERIWSLMQKSEWYDDYD